jgi:hypothetical protein
MQTTNVLNRFFFFCAGVDTNLLMTCPTKTIMRYQAIGMMVLIPAVMSLLSAPLALAYITENNGALLCSNFIVALLIFIIDRSIILFTKAQTFSIGLIMRVLLSLSLSFVIAEPLVLKIFSDVITEYNAKCLNTINTVTVSKYNTRIDTLNSQITLWQLHEQKDKDLLDKESDGSGGSGKEGLGPIYAAKAQKVEQLQKLRKEWIENNQAKIKNLTQEQQEELNSNQKEQAHSIAADIRALNIIAKKERSINISSWLIRILLLLIDLIPLMLKWSDDDLNNPYTAGIKLKDQEAMSRQIKLFPEWCKMKEQEALVVQYKISCENEILYMEEVAHNAERAMIIIKKRQEQIFSKKTRLILLLSELPESAQKSQLLKDIEQIYDNTLSNMYSIVKRFSSETVSNQAV